MGTRFTAFFALTGGGKRDRTADLLHAMQALSQLSYTPQKTKVRTFKSLDNQLVNCSDFDFGTEKKAHSVSTAKKRDYA